MRPSSSPDPTTPATPVTPSGASDPAPGRRAVLGAAAAAAAAPALLALSTPASAAPAGHRPPHPRPRPRPRRLAAGGDLGPNVLVFDPSTPDIQATLDEVFRKQEKAQFDTGR